MICHLKILNDHMKLKKVKETIELLKGPSNSSLKMMKINTIHRRCCKFFIGVSRVRKTYESL